MEVERGSLDLRDMENQKKDVQLRVIPSELRFQDAVKGRVYRLPLTVCNLGRGNQKIRFQGPENPQVRNQGVLEAGPQGAAPPDLFAP